MRLNATLFISAAIAVAALTVSANSWAEGETQAAAAGQEKVTAYQLQIPVAPLADALNQFGAQTGYQVVYKPELVIGLQSKAVTGKLSVDAALEALLKGTGLVWSRAGNTVVVKKVGNVPVAMVAVGEGNAVADKVE